MSVERLATLIATGERAAFHGRPEDGVEPLQQAMGLAHEDHLPAEAVASTWLLGVCLGACGRYGDAAIVLVPLADSRPSVIERRIFASLANSTLASLSRQVEEHAEAQKRDKAALELAGSAEMPKFDALLGLAADAVGLNDPAGAIERLAQAGELLEHNGDWWRQQIRHDWVRAEVALLTEDVPAARAASRDALNRAEAAGAPRHVAKSLLFAGVAAVESGDAKAAASALRRSTMLAESVGALPLVWPARAVLGALLAGKDPSASAAHLEAARLVVRRIADNLAPAAAQEWLAKPSIQALLDA